MAKDLNWELQCFGCTEEVLRTAIKNTKDPLMLASGILSDVQEVISGEFGEPDNELARQFINRAKFIIFHMMDKEDAVSN